VSGETSRPERSLTEYGAVDCPSCRSTSATVRATGKTRNVLFQWQQGRHPNGPRFGEKDKHPEAEVRCGGCNRVFWCLAPLALEDARLEPAVQEG